MSYKDDSPKVGIFKKFLNWIGLGGKSETPEDEPQQEDIPETNIAKVIGIPKRKTNETEIGYRNRFCRRASEIIEEDLRFQIAMGYINSGESVTNEDIKKLSEQGATQMADVVMQEWNNIPEEFESPQ